MAKNQINCEWLDGMPYSSPMCSRSMGRGSWIQCFNSLLVNSFSNNPKKNVICINGRIGIIITQTLFVLLLTVCKSRRNKIKAIKPAPIPIGARLIHASSWPNKSPVFKQIGHIILVICIFVRIDLNGRIGQESTEWKNTNNAQVIIKCWMTCGKKTDVSDGINGHTFWIFY